MCETEYELLAVIKLKKQSTDHLISCYCTRVFSRNKEDTVRGALHQTNQEVEKNTEKNLQSDNEALSCYFSTSHTDTLSTDEHESSEGRNNLKTSDSGDDGGNSRNVDLITDWQKFWSLNGEKLIWKSWITKYSAYINPDYLNFTLDGNSSENIPDNRFNYDDLELKNYQKSLLLRELTENDEISEGWNPLSPSSVSGETDIEQLLTAPLSTTRCGSVRTVDSMTNVTRMTVSSVDSNRTPTTDDSFSSISSVESSMNSTASSSDEEDQGNQWNCLWKKHYEEEYLIQYQKFLESNSVNLERIEAPVEEMSNLKISDQVSHSDNDEKGQMLALGLPLNFGRPKNEDGAASKKFNVKDKNSDFNSTRNKIKASFNLLGIEYSETSDEIMGGEVEYKTKHIRIQNRYLKLNKSKHIRFDDDGNEIIERSEENEEFQMNSDCSEDKLSSCEDDVTRIEQQIDKKDNTVSKKRKRKKKTQNPQLTEIYQKKNIKKFWHRRYSLFSKFDEGIQLDEESWYSVTPELVAKHIAERCKCDIIIDAFCGAGGNAIQFAFTCEKVIAIDIDPNKIKMAQNNAKIYGVVDKIEFIVGDFLKLAPFLKGDVVFMSPPWGGPSYNNKNIYDLEVMLQPVPFSELMDTVKVISKNIAIFLPKNSNTYDVMKHAGEGGYVEISQNFINKQLKAITVYYNDLIRKN